MAIELKHDKSTGTVTLTLEFQADAQVEKEGLEANVIAHHLWGQAADLCRQFGDVALHGKSADDLEAELDRERAELEAKHELRRRNVGVVQSNVVANPATVRSMS